MLDLAAETDRLLTFAEGSRHRDGGFARAGEPGEKRAYEHVFVVLAAASAMAAGCSGAADLYDDALSVLERRFWDERAGALVDVWNRDWTALEPYRGANATMHGVEAMLATGDPVWHERAVRVTRRLVRENHPRLNEHFDASWRPLPDYNRDRPAHPFRPYGGTVGHWFEWARLAFTLDAGFEADARRLFAAGVHEGWDSDGFVYTVDWDGRPVVRDRLSWVLCEAIAAAAVLGEEALQREWWELAERVFVDRDGGGWWMEVDARNRPSRTVWDGKPDVYHAFQATLIPRVPLAPSLAAALRG